MKYWIYFLLGICFSVLSGCGSDDDMPSFEEQLTADIVIIDDYLESNNIDAEVDESGIRYVHLLERAGDKAEIGDIVGVKIKGSMLNGVTYVVDSVGFTLTLANPLIAALQLAIPLMNEGERMIAYVPSVYCYGSQQAGIIPPNSNLVFEIELLSIIENESDQLMLDKSIIDEFLIESDIDAEIHSSGIRYTMDEEGTGNSPVSTDKVRVTYEGKFLNGHVFDSNNIGVDFELENLIEAWKIMIPEMKEGGKITIYAPSKYCYGTAGNSSIGPNTILTFEIDLISIQ